MAAIGAAGVVSSIAQTVYSVNAVGFVNLSLPQGFSLIANPLNGPSNINNLNAILPDAATPPVPDNTTIQKWDSRPLAQGGQKFYSKATFFTSGGTQFGWWNDDFSGPTDLGLNPGEGGFIDMPNAATLTFVGEVPQGNLSAPIPLAFSILSQLTPQELDVKTAGLPATDNDTIQQWNNATGQKKYFGTQTCFGGDWYDASFNPTNAPTPKIGEAFFFYRDPNNGTNAWTRTFNVSP